VSRCGLICVPRKKIGEAFAGRWRKGTLTHLTTSVGLRSCGNFIRRGGPISRIRAGNTYNTRMIKNAEIEQCLFHYDAGWVEIEKLYAPPQSPVRVGLDELM
jgi:hypothetical protein